MIVLGLDPGQTTGWALFRGEILIRCGAIAGGRDGFIEWAKTEMPLHDVLVVESFIVEPSFVGRSDASEVIGAAFALSSAPVKREQLRASKATLVKGDQTTRFNWLRARGFEGMTHELDAITHVLLYLRAVGHKAAFHRYWGAKKPQSS